MEVGDSVYEVLSIDDHADVTSARRAGFAVTSAHAAIELMGWFLFLAAHSASLKHSAPFARFQGSSRDAREIN